MSIIISIEDLRDRKSQIMASAEARCRAIDLVIEELCKDAPELAGPPSTPAPPAPHVPRVSASTPAPAKGPSPTTPPGRRVRRVLSGSGSARNPDLQVERAQGAGLDCPIAHAGEAPIWPAMRHNRQDSLDRVPQGQRCGGMMNKSYIDDPGDEGTGIRKLKQRRLIQWGGWFVRTRHYHLALFSASLGYLAAEAARPFLCLSAFTLAAFLWKIGNDESSH